MPPKRSKASGNANSAAKRTRLPCTVCKDPQRPLARDCIKVLGYAEHRIYFDQLAKRVCAGCFHLDERVRSEAVSPEKVLAQGDPFTGVEHHYCRKGGEGYDYVLIEYMECRRKDAFKTTRVMLESKLALNSIVEAPRPSCIFEVLYTILEAYGINKNGWLYSESVAKTVLESIKAIPPYTAASFEGKPYAYDPTLLLMVKENQYFYFLNEWKLVCKLAEAVFSRTATWSRFLAEDVTETITELSAMMMAEDADDEGYTVVSAVLKRRARETLLESKPDEVEGEEESSDNGADSEGIHPDDVPDQMRIEADKPDAPVRIINRFFTECIIKLTELSAKVSTLVVKSE